MGRVGSVGGGCMQWGGLASERLGQWEESGADGVAEWGSERRVVQRELEIGNRSCCDHIVSPSQLTHTYPPSHCPTFFPLTHFTS